MVFRNGWEWLKSKNNRKLLYDYGTSYSFGLQNFERNIKVSL
jgi:hypothetical protein